jgi:hypothetical protein
MFQTRHYGPKIDVYAFAMVLWYVIIIDSLNSQQITNHTPQLLQADVHRKEAALWIWLSQE